MSELPKGWIATTLGQVVNYAENEKFEPVDMEPNAWLLELEDIERDSSKLLDKKTVAERAPKSSKNKFSAGDVLYGKLRPYLNKVLRADEDGFCSSEIIPISAGLLNRDFIFHALRSPVFIEYVQSASHGMGMPRLGTQQAKAAPFLLPPLAEQTRIAQKLDELLAQVGTLKARLDAIPALLKRFRQSTLAAAVSGRLTADWRAEITSIDLNAQIDKILSDRSLSSKSKKVPASHLTNEEYEIPNTWRWVSLDSLAAKIVDGTHHTPTYMDHGIPFISVKDIRDGVIDFTNTKFITTEEHAELCKRCHPETGDLLITKSGTIGRTAIIPKTNEFSLFVSVALIKPASTLVNMQFINIALMKWVGGIDVSSRIVGSAIKNLHLTDMKVLAIPFAPLEEQTEIVRRVEQLFAFTDQLEAKIKTAQARVNHLTQSILAKAFRGELVPQDPNDEPASELLARIQAQRATAPKAKRGRKASA